MNDNQTTVLNRRDMIKLFVGAGLSVGAALVLTDPLSPAIESVLDAVQGRDVPLDAQDAHWGMVIDLEKCIGCDYCVYACQATNDVADDMRWNIHIVDQTATGDIFHVTRPCLHCQNAPCVNVCPVGATYHREDGLVMMDYDRCIGCRYCEVACPYGARSFNWRDRTTNGEENPHNPEWGNAEVERRPRGVVEKCTFCVHRVTPGVEQGLTPGVDVEATPACVVACPVEARYFGNLNDPDSIVSQIIASTPTLRLREDLGTQASVYYIPPEGLAI